MLNAKQIEAALPPQRETAAKLVGRSGATSPTFAHIGTFRNRPNGRVAFVGIRFYETPDKLGQALEHRCWFESLEVVQIA